ncbi:MAG: ABC transporter permease [Cyclobacteriaceae bacterium]
MRQLILLTGVELKEYIREPGVLFWAIFFPILLALGLGLAFSGGGEMEKTVAIVCADTDCVFPYDFSEESEGKLLGNEKIGYTRYQFEKTSWDESILMLKKGMISMILKVDGEDIRYHFDPNNAEANYAYLQLSAAIKGEAPDPGNITVLEQGGTRYIDFLIPGLLAMGVMMSCMWGISYSNVDRRNKKLLRRMVATPMKKYNYVASQLISRLMLSAIEVLLLVGITKWIFDISVTGSILAVVLLVIAGNVAFTGLAILIASRTANTQIANGLINLVVMPMMIMSGIYFSYHNFPDFMIAVIQFLPLTILADSIRTVFLEGATLINVLPELISLFVFGLVSYGLGIRIYKWY